MRTQLRNGRRSLAAGPVVTNFNRTVEPRCLISEVELTIQACPTAEQEPAGITASHGQLLAVSLNEPVTSSARRARDWSGNSADSPVEGSCFADYTERRSVRAGLRNQDAVGEPGDDASVLLCPVRGGPGAWRQVAD